MRHISLSTPCVNLMKNTPPPLLYIQPLKRPVNHAIPRVASILYGKYFLFRLGSVVQSVAVLLWSKMKHQRDEKREEREGKRERECLYLLVVNLAVCLVALYFNTPVPSCVPLGLCVLQ